MVNWDEGEHLRQLYTMSHRARGSGEKAEIDLPDKCCANCAKKRDCYHGMTAVCDGWEPVP